LTKGSGVIGPVGGSAPPDRAGCSAALPSSRPSWPAPSPWGGGRAHAIRGGGAPAEAQQDALGRAAEWITSGLEAAGVAVIVLGALVTTAVFLRDGLRTGGGGGAASST
jgi:hypothetical protein